MNGIGSAQQFPGSVDVAAPSSAAETAKARVPVEGSSTGAVPGDATRLSTVAGAVVQALSGSDTRAEKVAALRQSIAAGTYVIPASDVATKVLAALLR